MDSYIDMLQLRQGRTIRLVIILAVLLAIAVAVIIILLITR
jgi:hypothetical protein